VPEGPGLLGPPAVDGKVSFRSSHQKIEVQRRIAPKKRYLIAQPNRFSMCQKMTWNVSNKTKIAFSVSPKTKAISSCNATNKNLAICIKSNKNIDLCIKRNKLIAWGSVSASRFQAAGLAEGCATWRWPSTIDKELSQGLCGCLHRSQSPPGKL